MRQRAASPKDPQLGNRGAKEDVDSVFLCPVYGSRLCWQLVAS